MKIVALILIAFRVLYFWMVLEEKVLVLIERLGFGESFVYGLP